MPKVGTKAFQMAAAKIYIGDCPFCGSGGDAVQVQHKHGRYDITMWVECEECYARGSGLLTIDKDADHLELYEEVVDEWNEVSTTYILAAQMRQGDDSDDQQTED